MVDFKKAYHSKVNTEIISSFLSLVRLGIGHQAGKIISVKDWQLIRNLAEAQGLFAVVLDGVEELPAASRPAQETLLEWIGVVLQNYEYTYDQYRNAIAKLAGYYNSHGYQMMVLKGYACSLDWPKPEHRPCGDIDIWLFGKQKEADALTSKEKGIEVDYSHHHHTVFNWGEFTVENHYDFINTYRHYSHRGLERIFKELGQDDANFVEVNGEKVYLPSPNLHALFLIRHALNHFASTGVILRQVLDWAFFAEKHTNEIDWNWLKSLLDDYHMTDFFNCMNAICVEDLGFDPCIFHGVQFNPSLKDRVLADIISPEYIVENRIINMLKRWKGNQWKHNLCYREGMWSALWCGASSYILKPRVI